MDAKFYRELLDLLVEGVYFVDRDRRVTYWNKAAERLSGYAAQEVVGKRCSDNILRHVDELGTQLCVQGCPLAATIDDGQVREAEVFMHHKFGYRVPVLVRASPMRGEDGSIIGAVEVFSNNIKEINVLKELEILRKETLTDPLTGIGNRRYAEITLNTLEISWAEHRVPFGILFVDIDSFKNVNDTWGQKVGDLVLCMVAQTLTKTLRVLSVENSWVDHENGNTISVTASFGGAVSRKGESAAEVMDRADKQLYKSKESGRNCVNIDFG